MDDPVDGDRDRDEGSSGGDADLDPTEHAGEDAAQDAADSPAVPDEHDGEPDPEDESGDTPTADDGEERATDTDEDVAEPESETTGEGGSEAETGDTEDETDADNADADEPDAIDETEVESEEDEGEDGPTIDEEVKIAEDAAPPAGDAVEPVEGEATAVERKGGGPPRDQEQPLAEHIEEMVKRLAVVVVVAGAVSLAVFPYGEEIINFLWYSILPGTDVAKPHLYHPLELLLTQLKVASLAGLIIALPVFVYETYAFMRPGLYPHERRYYIAAIPTSLILAFVGVLFAYFIVLPAVMSYFLTYSQEVVDIAFALGQTFDLILVLMGYLALVFQIPLFIMLAIMMGLTTRRWMEDRRLIFWGVFAGISFLFSPDPTGMAPAIIALTMIALFEGTLLLLRWTGR